MNVPDDAPDLLHYNPQTAEDVIPNDFMRLYRQARRHFCYRVLKSTSADSVWQAAMRPRWSPAEHNTVEYRGRASKIAGRAWEEVRPATQDVGHFVDADPTLLDIHSGLAHTYDVRNGRIMPEEVALFNLRMWTTGALRWFWKHRLNGERLALFAVQKGSVTLEGIAPEPILDAYLSGTHDPPYKYR